MSKYKNNTRSRPPRVSKTSVMLVILIIAIFEGCLDNRAATTPTPTAPVISLSAIPAYSGDPYIAIDGNVPYFTSDDAELDVFETYSQLDSLGRCGTAYALIGQELMPTEERGSIASITPSGWINAEYDFIDGSYLYNRCHLIGYQLTGENDNERNLITGTRYLNIQGMLPFENMVADHIVEEEHHVLYRVTPVYDGEDLVASGVQMEAFCVECGDAAQSDEDKFMFHVYCYNVQPGVVIDYATGGSSAAEVVFTGEEHTYILNTGSMKFHLPGCSGACAISEGNREERTCTRDELVFMGYDPCGSCKP